MKAAVIYEFGPADVLKIEDLPAPVAQAGEVLVRVHVVRVGGLLDIGTRAGRNPFARLTFPHILGADFAGEVVEAGEGISDFMPGERVVAHRAAHAPLQEQDVGKTAPPLVHLEPVVDAGLEPGRDLLAQVHARPAREPAGGDVGGVLADDLEIGQGGRLRPGKAHGRGEGGAGERTVHRRSPHRVIGLLA